MTLICQVHVDKQCDISAKTHTYTHIYNSRCTWQRAQLVPHQTVQSMQECICTVCIDIWLYINCILCYLQCNGVAVIVMSHIVQLVQSCFCEVAQKEHQNN